MRILMTSDTVGGVWTYAMELCRALGAHGVEVALATMGAPVSAAQRSEVEQLRQVELFESHYKLEWMDDPWEDVDRAGRWMQELEERVRPEVIHLNGYAHGRQSWRAPVLMTAHSCVLSWWQAVKREPAPARWRHYRDAVREGLQRANLVVAPTAAMLGCIHEQYGIPRRARVIYNARDPSRFVAGRKEPIVLSAGRMWDEAKNLQALRAAAPSVPWRVYVAGDGGAEVKGPAEAVRLLRHLDGLEMARWMGRASIYALPARYEPFGLSILEAALSGCALVLGDIASLREVWGDAAVFVDPEDPGALGEQLQRLCTRPAERKALAMAAQRRAERYEPSRMAREYLDAYHELMGSAAGRSMPRPVGCAVTEDAAVPEGVRCMR